MKEGCIDTLKYIHLVNANTWLDQRTKVVNFILCCSPSPFPSSSSPRFHLFKKYILIKGLLSIYYGTDTVLSAWNGLGYL